MRPPLILALGAALGLAPGLAAAEPVRVGSGEHDGFARLVMPLPEGAGWSLIPIPGGVELRLPGVTEFRLADVFRRIGQDRVGALADGGDGRLAVEVSCDCHAKAFVHDGAWIVLDVVDGPAPPGAAGVVAPGGPAAAADVLALRLPSGPLIPLLPQAGPREPLLGPFATGPEGPPPPRAAGADRSAEGARRLAETEAAMLEGLAAAATEGFLDFASPDALPEPEPSRPAPPLPEAPAAGPLPVAAAGPGIALRTASTRPGAGPMGATGEACLPPKDFDLAAWAPSGDFGTEIGARSLALTDARDRLDAEGVEALARAYLAFGFGQEAEATLSLDGRRSRGRDLLLLLAALVDGEAASPDALAGQAGCAGPQALWRALARGTLEGTTEAERTAIEVALRALPAPLRPILSVRAAALFADLGEPLTAEVLLDVPAPPTPETAVVEAAVAGAMQGPEARLDRLERTAEDPRQAATALADLVDLAVAEDRALPEATLADLAARRFELRGTPEGALLRRAEARALAHASRFDEALALVAEGEGDFLGDERDALLAEILAGAAERLADAAFAELALDRLPPRLSLGAVAPVAARLEAMGFPDEAARLRQGAAAGPGLVPAAAPGAHEDPGPGRPAGRAPAGGPSAAEPGPAHGEAADASSSGRSAEPSAEAAIEAPAALPDPALAPTLAGSRALLDEAEAARLRALELLGAAPASSAPTGGPGPGG